MFAFILIASNLKHMLTSLVRHQCTQHHRKPNLLAPLRLTNTCEYPATLKARNSYNVQV